MLKVLEYIERHLFMQPPRTLSSHGRSLYYSVRKTEMVAKNNGSRWAHLFPRANIGNAIAFSFFPLSSVVLVIRVSARFFIFSCFSVWRGRRDTLAR